MRPATSRKLFLSDLPSAVPFYTSALSPLGYKILSQDRNSILLGIPTDESAISDLILTTRPSLSASGSSSTGETSVHPSFHISFAASSPNEVYRYYASAIAAGGKSIREPYCKQNRKTKVKHLHAIVDDREGNSIEVVHRPICCAREGDDPAEGLSIGKITKWATNVAASVSTMRDVYEESRQHSSQRSRSRGPSPTGSRHRAPSSAHSLHSVPTSNPALAPEARRAATEATGQTSGKAFEVVATLVGAGIAGIAAAPTLRSIFNDKDVKIIQGEPGEPLEVQLKGQDSGISGAQVVELQDHDARRLSSRKSRAAAEPSVVRVVSSPESAVSDKQSMASRPSYRRRTSSSVDSPGRAPEGRYASYKRRSPLSYEHSTGDYPSRPGPRQTRMVMPAAPSSAHRSRADYGSSSSSGSPGYDYDPPATASRSSYREPPSASRSSYREPPSASRSSYREREHPSTVRTSYRAPTLDRDADRPRRSGSASGYSSTRPSMGATRRRSSYDDSDASTLRPSNHASRVYAIQPSQPVVSRGYERHDRPRPLDLDNYKHQGSRTVTATRDTPPPPRSATVTSSAGPKRVVYEYRVGSRANEAPSSAKTPLSAAARERLPPSARSGDGRMGRERERRRRNSDEEWDGHGLTPGALARHMAELGVSGEELTPDDSISQISTNIPSRPPRSGRVRVH